MTDGSEAVTANTEQILDRTMDGKEKLGLLHLLESAHLAFLLAGVLV